MPPTRESILSSITNFKPKPVDVPAFGGPIFVRPLSVAGTARYLACKDPSEQSTIMLTDCICDENGERLFTHADEAILLQASARAVSTIMDAIGEISNPTTADAAGN